MEDRNWIVAPGQQLSLDLPEIQLGLRPDDPTEAFARVQHATKLLRELARALGEQRAAMDFEEYRRGLTESNEPK
jgi:hypothetical protein